MISYNNKEIKFNGCPACAYANGEFSIDCGMAYENDNFTVSQDWEFPIKGFFIVSPKRHIDKLSELTIDERNEMFYLVNKVSHILRDNNISNNFDYIIKERCNVHLHIWIIPRYEWMNTLGEDLIKNLGLIFDYAKTNLRNEDNYQEIKRITEIVKKNINM
jgi:diadenosine tetraphosphate (Ap4A) HIT family hydrolase